MDATNLVAYLPFDSSPTEDLCENTWTAYGSPTISDAALQLDGSSYLKMAEQFEFAEQPFTISCKFSGTSNTTGGAVCLWQMYIGEDNRIQLEISTSGELALWKDSDSTVYIQTAVSVLNGQEHHVECDFDGSTWYLFLDGNLIGTKAHTCTARNYTLYLGMNYWSGRKFTGTIDEFQIYDGVALHTENFTPPTAEDYAALKVALGSKRAQYLSFTGNAGCYAELPLDVLAGATTFTIEAKFSTTSTKSASDAWLWGTIAGREIPYFGKDDGALCVNDGKLCFWCSPASKGTAASNTQEVTSSAVVNDGAIHKVAVVSSDGAIDLYCDGVNVAHTDNVNAKITDAQTILIAYNSDSNSRLQMDLYELRFWNTARSAAEIFADIEGTEEGLEAWYIPTNSSTLVDKSGNGRDATLYGSPVYTELTELPLELSFDVERVIKNDAYIAQSLKVWLPFDNSPTEDLCGNEWTIVGSLAVEDGALALESSSTRNYLITNPPELGMSDFTIDWWEYIPASVNSFTGQMLGIDGTTGSNTRCLALHYWGSNKPLMDLGTGASWIFDGKTIGTKLRDQWVHRAIVRSGNTIYAFENGTLFTSASFSYPISVTGSSLFIGNFARANHQFVGKLKNVRIHVGAALWTENFTPPTAEYYAALKRALDGSVAMTFNFDAERKVKNTVELTVDAERQISNSNFLVADFDVECKVIKSVQVNADVERILYRTWRYENAGTADRLIISGNTLTNLPESKSITGTAFYQTARARCFDLPVTPEIWIKFDVYFDGSNRWRAYNGGANGTNGITAYSGDLAGTFAHAQNDSIANTVANICKTNQLQTVLLHMVSGSSDGIVEAWVDGTKIYTYTGDVNHGEDFADIYLQSDGAGTFFSNVIISNKKLDFGDGWHSIYFDVERDVTKTLVLNVDVERELIAPIYVPFIGEHFNHIIGSLNLKRGGKKKIILPKKSSVYIRATGDGAIRIFSDTDREGKKTGEFYAQLDECNTVFIVPTDSPLRVIRDFVHALSETTLSGTEALDEAINYCTRGIFDTRSAVVEKFMNDLSGFDASGDKTFLQDYCDINVANADTGAITGIDAGGGGEKTAQSIVPEPVPVEDWVVPVSGSSKTIHGLTINFPTSGASGALTDVEKHILAGLNSVWFDQCLKLVEKSFGLSFRDEDSTVKTINVEFENDSTNSALAYTAYTFDTTSGKTDTLRLVINMWYYNSIDTGSADGAATYTLYLDRTLAHELTHAVMAANIDNFNSLPAFIKEGIAELVHGIDNTRRSDITALVTSKRSDLQTIISGINTEATNSYFYSAGYLFLRYLAKQGQNDSFAPQTLEITNLLISDGATDSDYEALTDNTRQIFAADILRALSCSFEGEFDIAILSVLTVKVLTDVLRNIIAQVNLFARQKEEPFNPDIPSPEPTDLPVNTKGIRDFEVSIAEQQISDQVRFTAVTPYDVQQEISGQYLDYKYNMVIERVQQQGILHSCECFSNINDLLYTQLNYKIPPITSWYKINGEQVGGTQQTVEIKTVYPLASTHATSIAKALKLKAQIQFDNFLSTVLMDEKGGVTYNDLIRDIFGWSSRVPTMLINVFPRDGKLFFIQRGHETHSVDITQSKHTVPVITREIVRTSYGSSVESTTTINEYDITANTFTPDTIVGGEEGGEEEKWVTLQDKSSGENWTATTTYYYSKGNDMSPAGGKIPAGLLVKVETEKSYSYGSEEADSFTQIMHTYDSDGTRIGTETYVHYTGGTNPTTDTRNINLLRYITLPNGEKYLASESTERYEEGETGYPDKLVDSTITNHSPTRLGQTHVTTITDDGIAGGVTGQNTGDDRITPYSQKKAQATATALANANGTWEKTTTHYESGMTVYGLALFDSSFPIHDEATLIKVTNAIKALNGKIKETVSLTVYDLEHLIDFDDTITFNGNSYFLVSNTARTTPRIFLEQNLTLVRWT